VPLVSLVIPAMNEAQTIGMCISRARDAMMEMGVDWEIIVCDNSTDGTADIATSLGAKVIRPPKLGYGNAYLAGFKEARGKYLVLLDGDLTYDPGEMGKFISLLESEKFDLVMGTRLKGEIKPGAMPALHRYIGNPFLTGVLNLLFQTSISDAHCGMRAISREALDKLDLHTGGMEFASEMVIDAARKGLRVAEVPITYYPRKGESKLSSFSDGWRHLRFMMLYRPVPFLMGPGLVALLLGFIMAARVTIHAGTSDLRMHSLILGSLLLIIGYQTLLAGIYFEAFGAAYGISIKKGMVSKLMSYHSLEKELIMGMVLLAAGVLLGAKVLFSWRATGFGSLYEIQSAMMALILSILGIQTIFSGMFISLLLLGNGNFRRSGD
jgi:glycosyltransferase involved in cell wall biosynthesis